eukprot:scaffold101256_cov72-Phaeocystis_antarctica.AAC.8
MLGVGRHRITTRADPLAVAIFIGADVGPSVDGPSCVVDGRREPCDFIAVLAGRIPPQWRLTLVAAATLGLAAAHLVGQPGSRHKDRPSRPLAPRTPRGSPALRCRTRARAEAARAATATVQTVAATAARERGLYIG